MEDEFWQYYTQGQMHQKAGEYLLAIAAYKKALDLNKNYAEAWYQMGLAMTQLQRYADAGMHFRRAAAEYERRIQNEAQIDYNAFGKACALAHLQEKSQAIIALEKALRLNPNYAETILEMPVFDSFLEEDSFRELIKNHIDLLISLHYKGNKLQKNELNNNQTNYRSLFVNQLRKNNWEVDDFEKLWEAGIPVSPQATAIYAQNAQIQLNLDFYLDENLIFMQLLNRTQASDIQAYRLYIGKQLPDLLSIIIEFQNQLNMENWETMIEALIEVSESVILEMPDGRKVKVS